MLDDAGPSNAHAPSLSARAIQALTSTQGWARFSGIALFGAALLKAVQSGVSLAHLPAQVDGRELNPHTAAFSVIASGLVIIVIYCVLGWLAMRYAERLNHVRPPRRPDPADIARALGAQHSYWRFQGVMMIVGIALFVLVIVGAIAIGVIVAAAH